VFALILFGHLRYGGRFILGHDSWGMRCMETSSPKFVNNGCCISLNFVLKEWTQLRDLLSTPEWGCTALVAMRVLQ